MTREMSQGKKKIEILASFDDAGEYDMRLGDLLLRYEIPSVFYVPINFGRRGLEDSQIARLAGLGSCSLCPKMKKLFDIGSHGLNHLDLKKLIKQGKEKEAMREIAGSKTALEAIIKRPVTRFAYPYGQYNEKVKEMVKTAGYKSARTTKLLSTDFPKDPYETNISMVVHPRVTACKGRTWIEVGYELFDRVIKDGGRFGLYGHSYDIFGQFNMGEFFESFLSYMDEEMKKIGYPRKIFKHGEAFISDK